MIIGHIYNNNIIYLFIHYFILFHYRNNKNGNKVLHPCKFCKHGLRPTGRKPCLPAFIGERKVSYQLTTLNRWITVFYSLPEWWSDEPPSCADKSQSRAIFA